MFTCEFCQRDFSCKGNLTLHLKTAKYCLQLQGKTSQTSMTCDYCQKTFAHKHTLLSHVQICTDRMRVEYEMKMAEQKAQYEQQLCEVVRQHQNEINMLNEKLSTQTYIYEEKYDLLQTQIKSLETRLDHNTDCLTDMAKIKSSTTTINNNHHRIQNIIYGPLDLSKSNVEAILDQHLTTEVIGDGQKGVATMIHSKLLTDDQNNPLYVQTDVNRSHFVYQSVDGKLVKDVKAHNLKDAIVQAGVGRRAIDTVQTAFKHDPARMDAYLPKALEIAQLTHNDSKFRGQLACLASSCSNSLEEPEDEV